MRQLWINLVASLWFIPALIVTGAMILAVGMVALDMYLAIEPDKAMPYMFGAGAEGSRGMLQAIAGSMITVAGVVFSITIVSLSLASNQYSPRVLRNFMNDRVNQSVLGTFVGVFVYCIVVLRSIRSGEGDPFVPEIAVIVGTVLGLAGIAFLILFIHHIALLIQASQILAAVHRETDKAIEDMFPDDLGRGDDESPPPPPGGPSRAVRAGRTGYVQSVENDRLAQVARERDVVIVMECGVGDFTITGRPLAHVHPPERCDRALVDQINRAFHVNRQRTVEQDPSFGIRQLVDAALKALSPGINDPTTAVTCVNYLTAILVKLARRRIEAPLRGKDGAVCVYECGPTYASMLDESLDQIRRHAEGNVRVLDELCVLIETVGLATIAPGRRAMLVQHAGLIDEAVLRTVAQPHDKATLRRRVESVRRVLETPGG